MPNFRVIEDRVVIRRIEPMKQSAGGVFIPDTAKDNKPQEGVVVAVGPGAKKDDNLVPMSVKVDDRILFNKLAGTEVKMGDDVLLVLKEADIYGILQ